MKRLVSRATAVAALFVLGCGAGAYADKAQRIPADTARREARALAVPGAGVRGQVADEILVRYRPSATARRRATAQTRVGGAVIREFRSATGLVHLRVPAGNGGRALQRLRQDPDVLYAEPNFVVHALAIPSDPRFQDQWALHNTGQSGGTAGADIHAAEAWELTTGTREAVVAVVDSGVDTTHPDLAANLFRNEADCDGDGVDDDRNGYVDDCHGVDVTGSPGDPVDEDGHGTMVAGIIGAVGDDGAGVAGVAWQVSILPCRILDGNGEGTTAGAVACLDYVASMKDRGVDVIAVNASWGGLFYSQALADAVEALRRRAILLVTASGNDGQFANASFEVYPCALTSPNILCVSASTADDLRADFSNDGPQTVDLSAPGIDILSTLPVAQGGYGTGSGTSFAAPHVTGTLALLHAYFPGADWRELKNRILAGATPLAGSAEVRLTVTDARLDAYGALTCHDRSVTARLSPNTHRWLSKYSEDRRLVPAGAPLQLGVLHIDCGAPAGEVAVQVDPGGAMVVLRDDGVAPDVTAADGLYTAEWTPPVSGTYTLTFPGNDVLTVDADADLERGFPVRTWQEAGQDGPGANILTLVGDIDGAPGLEILVSGERGGPLFAFHSDGTPVPGWPVLAGGLGTAYPALGKLSPTTPGLQVVATYYWGGLAAYDGTGAFLPGWPVDLEPEPLGHSIAPTVSDVDGDGVDEVLSGILRRSNGRTQYVNLGGASATVNSPAIADLFGDGELELVTTGEPGGPPTHGLGAGWLNVSRMDGTSEPGFPVEIPGTYGLTGGSPVVGDVDGDGEPDIVFTGLVDDGQAGLLIYDRRGHLKRAIAGGGQFGAEPALADLDGDGIPEIVVCGQERLDVLRGDGTPYPDWHTSLTGVLSPACVVGDVDGDGQPDIIAIEAHGLVYVLDRHGELHSGFPKQLPLGEGATPAIADIDGDGRNEVIITAGYNLRAPTGMVERVWVYDLGGPPHGPVPWGQFMGNAQHTGTAVPSRAVQRAFHRLTVSLPASGDNGDVLSEPDGIWCPTVACARNFPEGTTVTLTARPVAGYEIAGWGGACNGSGPTCTVQLDGDRAVSVAFALPRPTLRVSVFGYGAGRVTSTPPGVDCTETCAVTFDRGTTVTLTATPAAGSTFAGWSGSCVTPTSCVVTLDDSDRVVGAMFSTRHAVSVARAGGGEGSVRSSMGNISCGDICSEDFEAGTAVLLVATPAPDSRFSGWSPALCPAQEMQCSVLVDRDVSVTATFELSDEGGVGGGGGGCRTGGDGSGMVLLALVSAWLLGVRARRSPGQARAR